MTSARYSSPSPPTQQTRCLPPGQRRRRYPVLSVTGPASTAHFRYIKVNGLLYTLSIETPNTHRDAAAAMKDKFFGSFELKGKSQPRVDRSSVRPRNYRGVQEVAGPGVMGTSQMCTPRRCGRWKMHKW
jgi:hypothetical protein